MPSEIRDSRMVLDWVVSRRVHEYLDTVGRPVGEGRAAIFSEIATEMRTCPYPGSRHHHEKLMNASAIQCMPPWPQMLGIMTWLSHRHRARYGRGVTNTNDLGQVTSAGILLVDFLALRRHNPVSSRNVPALVSGVYKVCLGYQLAYLPERFSDGEAPVELPDSTRFLESIEEDGLLVGQEEVCSCPPSLILQSYDAMIETPSSVPPPSLEDVSLDWDRFDDFAEGAGDMWQAMIMFTMRVPAFLPRLDEAELPPEVKERLNGLLLERNRRFLEERQGLLVDVAESIRNIPGTRAERPAARAGSGKIQPGTVAASAIEWLRQKAPEELSAHGVIIAASMQQQLGHYEEYQADILSRVNAGLSLAMKSLDFDAEPAIAEHDIAKVCGGTMSNWAAF